MMVGLNDSRVELRYELGAGQALIQSEPIQVDSPVNITVERSAGQVHVHVQVVIPIPSFVISMYW